jgi:hypothetical protein
LTKIVKSIPRLLVDFKSLNWLFTVPFHYQNSRSKGLDLLPGQAKTSLAQNAFGTLCCPAQRAESKDCFNLQSLVDTIHASVASAVFGTDEGCLNVLELDGRKGSKIVLGATLRTALTTIHAVNIHSSPNMINKLGALIMWGIRDRDPEELGDKFLKNIEARCAENPDYLSLVRVTRMFYFSDSAC